MEVALGDGEVESEHPWYFNVYRDTSEDPHIGRDVDFFDRGAAWRMAVSPDPLYQQSAGSPVNDKNLVMYPVGMRDPIVLDPADSSYPELRTALLDVLNNELGTAAPIPATPLGPRVPLYVMNASLGMTQEEIHGAYRPAAFPTVGFLAYVPRFAHKVDGIAVPTTLRRYAMGRVMYEHWFEHYTGLTVPADFGHMPLFDNKSQDSTDETGELPWGLRVFDYFTTLNPRDPNGDGDINDALDPYRVGGRININTASWYVLAGLPIIGPNGEGNLPIQGYVNPAATSPAFYSYDAGVLVGEGSPLSGSEPRFYADVLMNDGWWRLGPYLAEAAAAYRDRVQYVETTEPYAYAWQRNDTSQQWYRRTDIYGEVRGHSDARTRGFVSIGELANVVGFDRSKPLDVSSADATVLGEGDFMKAASLLALLDTQFLTTRSNTFTVYTALLDREDPQASVRSQITVDRSNLLPRAIDPNGDGLYDDAAIIQGTGQPEVISRRESSYFTLMLS
jgi:hypothetical protein